MMYKHYRSRLGEAYVPMTQEKELELTDDGGCGTCA
jgi:hypothetical protein